MRYEKSAIVLRIALDMQGSALGLSLEDIRRRYADRALSRRTAERLRDAVESLFPQIERANPGEVPKRWRLPGGTLGALAGVSADELADLNTSISVLRRENMDAQALSLERILSKMQALMKRAAKARVEPDLEALIEAEGLATRPGPRPTIDLNILGRLREAIITRRKVRFTTPIAGAASAVIRWCSPMGFYTGSATTSWRGARSIGQRTFAVLRCRTLSGSSCWRKLSRASVDFQFRNTPSDHLASSRKSLSTSSGSSRQKRPADSLSSNCTSRFRTCARSSFRPDPNFCVPV